MIFVYIQYIYALIAIKISISKGYHGKYFPNGLYPGTIKMLEKKEFIILDFFLYNGVYVSK